MADFINEVEEELRKDEYNKLLKKWGPFLLGVIIAIIAVAGYLEWKKSTSDRAARATSAAYVEASDLVANGDPEAAYLNFLDIAEQAPSGYSGLALTRAAAIKLDEGKPREAVTLFDKAAQRFTAPRHVQLAQIKAAYILAGQGNFDDVIARTEPLAVKGEPYEYLARELLGFSALQMEDYSKARQQFSYLGTIPGVPESIQSRAQQNLAVMKVGTGSVAEPSPDPVDIPENETPPAPEGEEPANE